MVSAVRHSTLVTRVTPKLWLHPASYSEKSLELGLSYLQHVSQIAFFQRRLLRLLQIVVPPHL